MAFEKVSIGKGDFYIFTCIIRKCLFRANWMAHSEKHSILGTDWKVNIYQWMPGQCDKKAKKDYKAVKGNKA